MRIFGCGLLAAALGMSYSHISPWISAGFALAAMTLAHMVLSSRFCLPLPQTAVLIASIYYVFAPVVSVYYPAKDPLYRILDSERYFSFAVPALWATALGWSFAFYGFRPHYLTSGTLSGNRRLYTGLDLMIAGGLLFCVLSTVVRTGGSLGTVIMLVSNVRYVGVFGWVLMGRKGWKARLAAVLAVDLYASVASGFFLNFVLWSISVAVVVIYRYRVAYWKTLLAVALGALLLPCLQYAKWELRRSSWGVSEREQRLVVFGETYEMTRFNKPVLLLGKIIESGFLLLSGRQTDEFMAETCVRYNQGWIVDRIQAYVPRHEKFADGETIYDSVIASLVPRFFMPGKMKSGGQEVFSRFTGIVLNSTTSMNLGFVGEMYANFGYYGGIAGCGVYGLFFGVVFNWLNTRAQRHLVVLGFIPYILNFAVVSEVGVLEVLNYTVKASWVAVAVYYGAPAVFSRFGKSVPAEAGNVPVR